MTDGWRLGGNASLGGGSAVGDASGLASCRFWVRIFLIGGTFFALGGVEP
jgi:hypothetical protein